MGFFDWFNRRTPLQMALERGMASGKFAEELEPLGEIEVSSAADANAICDTLEAIHAGKDTGRTDPRSSLHPLLSLFQQVEDNEAPAASVFAHRGTELLSRLAETALSKGGDAEDNVLFIFKILALYGSRRGARLIVRSALAGFRSEDWLWSVVFGIYQAGHPDARFLYTAFCESLPPRFTAVALLDAANALHLEGGAIKHPFESDPGVIRLREWLTATHPSHFSYAVSAVAALPFVDHPARQDLLETAMKHPSADVQLEAAWAAAKLGLPSGLQTLGAMCLNVSHAARARTYLHELKAESHIPAEASEPGFQARAEFSQWLAHPNELGRAPEEVDLYDHRTLPWPPDFASIPVWLVRYRAKDPEGLRPDDIGVGMVGSATFCFFSYDIHQRPPEDGYALHCCWEMEHAKLIEIAAPAAGSQEYDGLLAQWAAGDLHEPRIGHVMELSPELRHPQRLVAVAAAHRAGASGWVVLDGPDSRWYPAAELLPGENAKTLLKMHVGRQLLHLPLAAERLSWVQSPPSIPPEQLVARYEALLDRDLQLSEDAAGELLDHGSPLTKSFAAYVEAALVLRGGRRSDHLIAAYERLLKLVGRTTHLSDHKVFDRWSPLAENFDEYIQALIERGRIPEVVAYIDRLTPVWSKNFGGASLGLAALAIGHLPTAEQFFLKVREANRFWLQGDSALWLAEVWQRQGKSEAARDLVLECLRHSLAEAAEATGSDVEFWERRFQKERAVFERLFPEAHPTLSEHKIPSTTLRQPEGRISPPED